MVGDDQYGVQASRPRSDGGARIALADGNNGIFLPDEHIAEDRMLVIEMRRGGGGDEELAAIGARTGVRHRQQARPIKGQIADRFVFELIARTAASGRSGRDRRPAP